MATSQLVGLAGAVSQPGSNVFVFEPQVHSARVSRGLFPAHAFKVVALRFQKQNENIP